jgi:hypothetical protein
LPCDCHREPCTHWRKAECNMGVEIRAWSDERFMRNACIQASEWLYWDLFIKAGRDGPLFKSGLEDWPGMVRRTIGNGRVGETTASSRALVRSDGRKAGGMPTLENRPGEWSGTDSICRNARRSLTSDCRGCGFVRVTVGIGCNAEGTEVC